MKVFLVSKNAAGDTALEKLMSLWNSRQRFRLLRIMGNRVHFSKVKDLPLTIQYSQIDFQTLPKYDEYCNRITKAAYASLEMYGVKEENTQVVFE